MSPYGKSYFAISTCFKGRKKWYFIYKILIHTRLILRYVTIAKQPVIHKNVDHLNSALPDNLKIGIEVPDNCLCGFR